MMGTMTTTPMFNDTISMLNTTTNYTEEYKRWYLEQLRQHSLRIMTPTIVFLTAVAVVGAVGNSLVLLVYTRSFTSKPTRIFILTLSIFDLITNLFVIPLDIHNLFKCWIIDIPSICRTKSFLYTFNTLGSSLALLAICVTRYRKICKPYAKQVTVTSAKVTCVVIALVSLFLATPTAVINGVQTVKTPTPGIFGKQCWTDDAFARTILPSLNAYLFIALFVLICTPLVVLYIMIGCKAHRRKFFRGSTMKTATKAHEKGSDSTKESSECRVCTDSDSKCSGATADSNDISRQNTDIQLEINHDKNTSSKLTDGVHNLSIDENESRQNKEELHCLLSESDVASELKDVDEDIIKTLSSSGSLNIDNSIREIPESLSIRSDKTDLITLTESGVDLETSATKNKNNCTESKNREDFLKKDTQSKKRNNSNLFSTIQSKFRRDRITRMSTNTIKGSNRTTVMLAIITIAFITSFLPFLSVMYCKLAAPKLFFNMSPRLKSVYEFMLRSYLLNTAVNPVVYSLCDVNFRRECFKLLRFW
ncbi:histamine H1 receptor-like [Physella acuta]|uniref:histamine H1 receptor-like n=1 Tax=Physella acuta TaxID=109671 RepID=UPI0027DB75AA|nr:histamine H1 receptor-like [Physella acuta]